jgi:hypothetical protein
VSSVSVAFGPEAVQDLKRLAPRPGPEKQGPNLSTNGDMAVIWDRHSPWISSHESDEILVVLDGSIHTPRRPLKDQARFLHGLYVREGHRVASGVLGDFVLIIVDRLQGVTLVARDPIGVRPWYIAEQGKLRAGSSDVATLVSMSFTNTQINDATAIRYLAARSESNGQTIYEGIKALDPGETWMVDTTGSRRFSHHRWNLEIDRHISWPDAAERCRSILDLVVQDRLESTKTPTSQLSGGIDSSTVVGTIAKLGLSDLVVERLVFDSPRADETFFSDLVIGHWGIDDVSRPPWLPTREEAIELTHRIKRPLPDPNFTMFLGLYRTMAREGRLTTFTGLGGDDAFAASSIGSRMVSSFGRMSVIADTLKSLLREPSQTWSGRLKPSLFYIAPWKGPSTPGWLSPKATDLGDLREVLERKPTKVTGVAAVDERIANITSGYDSGILEARALICDLAGRRETHPFLDPRFIEATYCLHPSWPNRDGHTRAFQVAAFSDRLPQTVVNRTSKVEFSEVFWPQFLEPEALESVVDGPLRDLGWIDYEGFNVLANNAREGRANYAIPLSRCISVDRWLRSL